MTWFRDDPHENVIQMLFYYATEFTLHIAMPYYMMTMRYAVNCGVINKRRHGRQLALGLRHIHAADVMHRDLKMNNILYSPKNNGTVVIADLGSAIKMVREPKIVRYETPVTTINYRAPEVILCNGMYNDKIDVWSLGIVLLKIDNDTLEFNNTHTHEHNALEIIYNQSMSIDGKLPDDGSWPGISNFSKWKRLLNTTVDNPHIINWHHADAVFDDLLRHILVMCPRHRYNIQEVLQHPYFAE